MTIRSFLFLFLLLTLASCIKPEDDIAIIPPDNYNVPVINPSGGESYITGDSDYIFDQDKLLTFELKIPQSALATLDQDPAAEEYVEGSLIFEGDTISPVGVRYKGSVGAFVGCLSGINFFEPSGSKTCTKLSMKVKINWEGREEKFFKLKKLQFHSMNNDPSQMRERLGYYLFGAMGVPTPRAVHARLVINDLYVGLFALIEQIDNRFIKENFDDDKGNLYKEIWPLNMEGVPYTEDEYKASLRTNEDDNPNVDIIRDFGQNIKDANTSQAKIRVEQTMNIDNVIAYAVVDRTIKHDDGPFHWYCFGGDCSNHNYFWYEEPTAKRLHLIPWDLDNAFENITGNNSVTAIRDNWGETQNNCDPFNTGFLGIKQWSASCDKLTKVWSTYEDEFEQTKQDLINGPMSQANVDQLLETWQNQIREATLLADESHSDAISMDQWQEAITQLEQQLDFARNN